MKVKSFSYISVVEGKVLPPYCEVSGEFFKQNSLLYILNILINRIIL